MQVRLAGTHSQRVTALTKMTLTKCTVFRKPSTGTGLRVFLSDQRECVIWFVPYSHFISCVGAPARVFACACMCAPCFSFFSPIFLCLERTALVEHPGVRQTVCVHVRVCACVRVSHTGVLSNHASLSLCLCVCEYYNIIHRCVERHNYSMVAIVFSLAGM